MNRGLSKDLIRFYDKDCIDIYYTSKTINLKIIFYETTITFSITDALLISRVYEGTEDDRYLCTER